MTLLWRMLPDGTPKMTIPVLWCLTVFTVIAVGTGADGLSIGIPRAAREAELWLSILICMVLPILAVSSWGLVFRWFAFGSAWIAVTLTLAALVSGCSAAIVIVDARGKDSIGHGLVLLFGTPLLFVVIIAVSSVLYGVHWKRRCRLASHESPKC